MSYRLELIPEDKIFTIIPLLRLLNDTINVETLEARIKDMLQQEYKCVGVYDGSNLVGISGLWILNKYYIGKHIEPDNVFIHPDYQDKGIGTLLITWIEEYAKSIGCRAAELNCYVANEGGMKFWLNSGFKLIGFHFQKKF